jgi:dihydrofolate reductase
MPELLVDFITSLDGYGAGEGWPGHWGLAGPEYLASLEEDPSAGYLLLMGPNTYRLLSGVAEDGEPGTEGLAGLSKVVFSSSLEEPLSWPNTRLVRGDAVAAVADMKANGTVSMRTIGSLTLCRSLLRRIGGPLPSVRVSRHHRKHRPRAHLRRLSRCRHGHDQQPYVRRPHPAARIHATGPRWSAQRHNRRRLTNQ